MVHGGARIDDPEMCTASGLKTVSQLAAGVGCEFHPSGAEAC